MNEFFTNYKFVEGAPDASRGAFGLELPVNDEIKRAWDIVSNTRVGAGRCLWRPFGGDDHERKLEGMVTPSRSFALTQEIKCADGALWVIDYDEQSPYQAFMGRNVVACGFPCHPPLQHRICVTGHFAVSKDTTRRAGAGRLAHRGWAASRVCWTFRAFRR